MYPVVSKKCTLGFIQIINRWVSSEWFCPSLFMGGMGGARCHPISLESGRSRIGRYLVQASPKGHLEAEAGDTKMDRATRSCGKRIYPLVMSK